MHEAFLLGAGLGTRLRPLTNILPKPLIPVANRPLITHTLDLLIRQGWQSFLINTHHLPAAWPETFGGDGTTATYRGCPIRFAHEPLLLDTGGGIKNIEPLRRSSGPLLICNGDILHTLNAPALLAAHHSLKPLATLGLRSFGGPLTVSFDPASSRVLDIGGRLGNTSAPRFLFTGLYVVSPEIFHHIPPGQPHSIITTLLALLRDGAPIAGLIMDSGAWMDLGTPSAYFKAHQWLASLPPSHPLSPARTIACPIPSSARISGFLFAAPPCRIPAAATLHNCILWPHSSVQPGARLAHAILTPQGIISPTKPPAN